MDRKAGGGQSKARPGTGLAHHPLLILISHDSETIFRRLDDVEWRCHSTVHRAADRGQLMGRLALTKHRRNGNGAIMAEYH